MNVGPNPVPNNRKRRAQNTIFVDSVVSAHRAARSFPGSTNMQPMMVQAPIIPRRLGKRPIDKALINVIKATIDATQVSTTLATASNACTITGIRWMIAHAQDAGTGLCSLQWALVIVRDGNSANTINQSDAGSFYDPEQNCLVFAQSIIDNNTETKIFEGNTKTMRKMLIGDKLVFIAKGAATNTSTIRGTVQFFCKT